jgi:hypothetical protein
MHQLSLTELDQVIDAIAFITSISTSVVDAHVDNRSFPTMPPVMIRVSLVREINSHAVALVETLHSVSNEG